MTVATIRQAFANALATIPHLNVSAHFSERINPPQAMIDFRSELGAAMSSTTDTDTWIVWIYARRTSDREAGEFLDNMRDSSYQYSVQNVIENNAALNAICSVNAITCSEINIVNAGGAEYMAVMFEFVVYT